MKRLSAAFVAALWAVLVASPQASAASKYSQSVVQHGTTAAEPKVAVDTRPHHQAIYVVAPGSSSTELWKSTNGGVSFRMMSATDGGSGDSDIAVDANGAIYVADLRNAAGNLTFPVSTSTDGGRTYDRLVEVAPTENDLDREWVATNRSGHVLGTAVGGSSLLAWVSSNAARSFRGPVTIAENVSTQGPIVAGPDHVYYTIYADPNGLEYAKSRDGLTWTTGSVAAGHQPALFPVIAADRSGNLYAVWSDVRTPDFTGPVYFVRSSDHGVTWTDPVTVSPSAADVFGTTPSAVFPWVVAGSRGKVAVSYALAHKAAGPDLGGDIGSAETTWDMVIAQTSNALARRPVWSSAVAAHAFHTGSICQQGLTCASPENVGLVNLPLPFDRRDLDFFGAATDAAGNVFVAYNRDRPITSGDPNDVVFSQTDILLARQTGGPRLR